MSKNNYLTIPELKEGKNLKYLPKEFEYNFYYNLSKEESLKKWAWQFQQRLSGKVSFLDSFLLISDNNKTVNETESPIVLGFRNNLETDWQNGVYSHATVDTITEYNSNDYSSYSPAEYIDEQVNRLIRLSNGMHISYNKYENNQKLRKEFPIQVRSYNLSISFNHESNGFTVFKNSNDKNKFLESIKKYESTRAFLINLQMPTSKIINELKEQIKSIKKKYKIIEAKTPHNKIFQTWAIGLACWDLKHHWKLGNVEIQGRYLYFIKEGLQELKITDDDYKKLFSGKYSTVKKMINGGWKKLTGEPN